MVQIECAAKDLHSGVFGGTVNEGMSDLVWMMNQVTCLVVYSWHHGLDQLVILGSCYK